MCSDRGEEEERIRGYTVKYSGVYDKKTEKGQKNQVEIYAATEGQTAKDRRVVRGGSECLLCTEKRQGVLGKASSL